MLFTARLAQFIAGKTDAINFAGTKSMSSFALMKLCFGEVALIELREAECAILGGTSTHVASIAKRSVGRNASARENNVRSTAMTERNVIKGSFRRS